MTHLLHRALQAVHAEFERDVGYVGITPRQVAVLAAVKAREGASQTYIVAVTGIDRSTLADIARRLQQAGLIQRKRSRGDARQYELRLTEAGQKALVRTQPAIERIDNAVLAALPMHYRAAFRDSLKTITEALSTRSTVE